MTNSNIFTIDITFKNGKTLSIEKCSAVESVVELGEKDRVEYHIYIYLDEDILGLIEKALQFKNVQTDMYSIKHTVYDEASSNFINTEMENVNIPEYIVGRVYTRVDEQNKVRYLELVKEVSE
jgi:hypothetical protein